MLKLKKKNLFNKKQEKAMSVMKNKICLTLDNSRLLQKIRNLNVLHLKKNKRRKEIRLRGKIRLRGNLRIGGGM
jgi:hypothetical protein